MEFVVYNSKPGEFRVMRDDGESLSLAYEYGKACVVDNFWAAQAIKERLDKLVRDSE